jgi:tRNA-splicing ligase RtcB
LSEAFRGTLNKLDDFRYEIPRSYKPQMRTTGIIFADEKMLPHIKGDNAPDQVANVATMPGIVGSSLAMPDIHWGYGFPVGGVAAFDINEGVISPGGIGYDINCGVRLVRTDLELKNVQPRVKDLIDAIFVNVPSGVGSEGKVRLSHGDLSRVMREGANWAVEKGYGWKEDIERIEARGCLSDADSGLVSQKAATRGVPQLGSLGAGNHFLEVQRVDKIYAPEAGKALGIDHEGQITVMIHTGSRGFGHQIATDYIAEHERAVRKYNISLPDMQLACAPIGSKEGDSYWKAMCCAANFAWANRQMIVHWVRQSFEKVFGTSADSMGMKIVYDVCHNIGKIEEHTVGGQKRKVVVHRKGATRAFPPGHPETPGMYKSVGQPVLIPGDMGSCSFVLVGLPGSMEYSFGSSCHGAGRAMSRTAATRKYRAADVERALREKGIYIKAASKAGIVEEAPGAYKNVEDVVRVAEGAGLTKIVARLVPIGVMKG